MTDATQQSDASEQLDWFRLTNDFHYRGTGEIRNRSEKVVWHHCEPSDQRTLVTQCLPSWATSFFRRPDFVLLNDAEEEELRISQVKRFPRRRFVLTARGLVVGEIEERAFEWNGNRTTTGSSIVGILKIMSRLLPRWRLSKANTVDGETDDRKPGV